jgi:hypothetical protein
MPYAQVADWRVIGLAGGLTLTLLGGGAALWLSRPVAMAGGRLTALFWPTVLVGPATTLVFGGVIAVGPSVPRPGASNGEPSAGGQVCMCPEGRVGARQQVLWRGLPVSEGEHFVRLGVSGASSAAVDGDWAVCVGVPETLAVAEGVEGWVPWGRTHGHPATCDRDRDVQYQTYLYVHESGEPFAGLPPLPVRAVQKRAQYRIGLRWGEGIPRMSDNDDRLRMGPATTVVIDARGAGAL